METSALIASVDEERGRSSFLSLAKRLTHRDPVIVSVSPSENYLMVRGDKEALGLTIEMFYANVGFEPRTELEVVISQSTMLAFLTGGENAFLSVLPGIFRQTSFPDLIRKVIVKGSKPEVVTALKRLVHMSTDLTQLNPSETLLPVVNSDPQALPRTNAPQSLVPPLSHALGLPPGSTPASTSTGLNDMLFSNLREFFPPTRPLANGFHADGHRQGMQTPSLSPSSAFVAAGVFPSNHTSRTAPLPSPFVNPVSSEQNQNRTPQMAPAQTAAAAAAAGGGGGGTGGRLSNAAAPGMGAPPGTATIAEDQAYPQYPSPPLPTQTTTHGGPPRVRNDWNLNVGFEVPPQVGSPYPLISGNGGSAHNTNGEVSVFEGPLARKGPFGPFSRHGPRGHFPHTHNESAQPPPYTETPVIMGAQREIPARGGFHGLSRDAPFRPQPQLPEWSSSRRRMNHSGAGRTGGLEKKELPVPESIVRRLVGRGGATVTNLECATGATVTLKGYEGDRPIRMMRIEGIEAQVHRCYHLACARLALLGVRLEAPREVEATVLRVPEECVGRVVGPKGTTARVIEHDSGAVISITRRSRLNPLLSGEFESGLVAEEGRMGRELGIEGLEREGLRRLREVLPGTRPVLVVGTEESRRRALEMVDSMVKGHGQAEAEANGGGNSSRSVVDVVEVPPCFFNVVTNAWTKSVCADSVPVY
uniref:K Homology domain-containing protein n=1 Tax=Chromera velia CCMP2878 TaxID=1169474 RepID=A0A0G4FBI7_9ALVE|eukprot:Cvel_16167.t1-p1 / transcript=Cvel_16167.t1 / gene=Cvel_16167 / organism=Chromera_velia_CCMP2878 / gene_product=hypothetical protein / transcript_product=hypothetical protein / location=Cvel_scaffold1232:24152-27767(-) / protein_length=701 / sequence_SO=supercontig / SO=protein_coding / is_pseudo=false